MWSKCTTQALISKKKSPLYQKILTFWAKYLQIGFSYDILSESKQKSQFQFLEGFGHCAKVACVIVYSKTQKEVFYLLTLKTMWAFF